MNIQDLLETQRQKCLEAYLAYYAGSLEDHAPDCVVKDILNAKIEFEGVYFSEQGYRDILFERYEAGLKDGLQLCELNHLAKTK